MKGWKYFFAGLGIVLSGSSLHAQDAHFSQFYNTPLFSNPAYTGVISGNMRAGLAYRKQWTSVSGSGSDYTTLAASADGSFFKRKTKRGNFAGLGLSFFNDKAGDSKFGTTTVNLSGSYVFSVSYMKDMFVSIALQGGYNQRSFSPGGLKWDNQWNVDHYDESIPGEIPGSTSKSFMDLTVGGMFFYTGDANRKYHIGAAFHHLNGPNVSFYGKERLKRKYFFHGGATYGSRNSNKVVQPYFMLSKQGRHYNILFGSYLKYITRKASVITGRSGEKSVSIGAFYRVMDAVILAARYEVNGLAVGITYDITLSGFLKAANGMGGPELTLLYNTAGLKPKKAGKYKNVKFL